jgi:hypothetical protein
LLPCRVELCRSTGRTLKAFSFAECDGGSGQEFRGVPRVQLLRALQERLPQGCVQFGAGVDRVDLGSGGGGGATLQLSGGAKLRCGLLVRASACSPAAGSCSPAGRRMQQRTPARRAPGSRA